jgi:hypothetical protein
LSSSIQDSIISPKGKNFLQPQRSGKVKPAIQKAFVPGIIISFLLTGALGLGNLEAFEVVTPSAAPVIIFTGTIFPSGHTAEDTRQSRVLKVDMGDNGERTFVIDDAENLAGVQTAHSILENIHPRRLVFTGPEEITARLRHPDLNGKKIKVTGYLYKGARRFQVSNVEKLEQK